MSSHRLLVLVIGLVLLVAADVAAAQRITLQPRVMMSGAQRDRVQAVANQGPDALRQFLWRTRMIYGWTWDDLRVSILTL
jgi:hypothetical protein